MGSLLPYGTFVLGLITATIAVLTFRGARRKSRDEASDRHEANGPDVQPVRGTIRGRTVEVRLQLVGGPPTMHVVVRGNAPWCTGVTNACNAPRTPGTHVEMPAMHPTSAFAVWAHLTVEPCRVDDDPLPLRVEIEADDDRPQRWWRRYRPRRWTRHVMVPLQRPPGTH